MAEPAGANVLDQVRDLLGRHGVPFDLRSHEPVYTSAQAAQVRGESLHSGAKALIVKADQRFVLLVLPGDCQLDSKAAKAMLAARNLRFAMREEVDRITGLQPGSIPPFGRLFGLQTYCDAGLAECERINFNAGTHTESVRMAYGDYLVVEKPVVGAFARPGK